MRVNCLFCRAEYDKREIDNYYYLGMFFWSDTNGKWFNVSLSQLFDDSATSMWSVFNSIRLFGI